MPSLFPNVPFGDGQAFTPDHATLAFQAPIFDGQNQYLGHRDKIADVELSDSAGQLKQRVSVVTDALKVTLVSGLTVAYASGVIRKTDGSLLSIAAGQIVVPNNADSVVFLDTLGAVKVSTSPDVVRYSLAAVTTVSGTVTAITDLRDIAIRPIMPLASSIRSFGGRGDEGDFVATNGQDLDKGEYYFSSFTVPAGISITINKLARIYVSGDVNIAGTITVPAWVSGGGQTLFITFPGGVFGGESGSGFGGGSGEQPKGAYNHLVSPVGSGGGAGYGVNNGSVNAGLVNGSGGNGGGCLWIAAAGTITVSGTIIATGSAGSNGAVVANGIFSGGAGGGSGGLVLLQSLKSVTVTSTGIIDVSGGAGGAGYRNATTLYNWAEPGSGGGGGRINISAPAINTTEATLNIAGGALGTIITTTYNGAGSGGIGGTGGSYGGLGGHQAPFAAGNAGVITYRYFAPVG